MPGGHTERVEGGWSPAFLVMIEFPDLARARHWYHSPEYTELKQLRLGDGRCNAVIVDGV